jgi:hypothetical protein
MKISIINSSELSGCWASERWHGLCQTCVLVQRCKFPEAASGRLVLAQARVDRAVKSLSEANTALRHAKIDVETEEFLQQQKQEKEQA